MSVIVFATGGTTEKSRTVEHPWEHYQFVTSSAAHALSPLFNDLAVTSVANCLGAGNLWGGFLFAHEICKLLKVKYFPYASIVDAESLCEAIDDNDIDTIICLPSFLERVLHSGNIGQLSSLRTIFYLGEMFPASLVDKVKQNLQKVIIKPLAYTSQETGPIGYQCAYLEGNHYHIYEHVKLRRNSNSGELSVSVHYPGHSHLIDHKMSDVGQLEQDALCACGHRGDLLHLHGRVLSARNILGTSISIYEFVHVLSAGSANEVSEADVQLVELRSESQGLGLLLMIRQGVQIPPDKIPALLKTSPLIKELIGKSSYFHVHLTDREEFLRSDIAQKIKPFITADCLPSVDNAFRIVIK
ncbi:hypothetical protein PSI15_02895 [Xenorhabdus sp. PR6a]|uniref:hypothetical protein n=1 Tax=Xenorhabdus sp. PR6a TaxID=3025877 RepID=UPI002358949F|nr:hypothetical protein [Xenorhabdus sp. PR6a]MDC9580528.1 hypothetical protein [Xenorhabdus sp. PR6a]